MSDAPQTLFQLAGAPTQPSPLDGATLVIVDAQREYVSGKLPLAGVAAAIGETAGLLALARKNGMPVVHVVHKSNPGAALFDPSTPFAEIVPELTPAAGEEIIGKRLPNAFAGTNLADHLRGIGERTGRKELILA